MSAGRIDARDVHELIALIELQGLVALHHQVAVGLHVHHRHGQAARQAIALRAGAFAVKTIRAVHRIGEQRRASERHALSEDRGRQFATVVVLAVLVTAVLAALVDSLRTMVKHIAHPARLEVRKQLHLLAGLIDRPVGARRGRRQLARDDGLRLVIGLAGSRPQAVSSAHGRSGKQSAERILFIMIGSSSGIAASGRWC